MGMTTTLMINIALDVVVSTGVLALAAWAMMTGERDRVLEAERAATA
jgi:hypothetical protein